jgi:hypothetical protein
MPFSENELRDVVATVQACHGDQALAHVAERIGSMILAGDEAGVATWKAVADRLFRPKKYPSAVAA